jgi:hypothetical protein
MCLQCLISNLPQTIYCERGYSQFFASEPVNALSNFSFFIAGYLGYRLIKKSKLQNKQLFFLPWLLVLIGIGSLTYHTFRSPITVIFDFLPTYLFIASVLFIALKELTGNSIKSLLILIGFVVIEILLTIYTPRDFLNNSIRHVVALGFIIILGKFLIKSYGQKIVKPLVIIISLYILAILFRSADLWFCAWIPFGTHFLWHILVSFAGYKAISLLILIKPSILIKKSR